MKLKGAIFFRVGILIIILTVFIAGTVAVFSVRHHRRAEEEFYITKATVMSDEVQRLLLWNDRVGINARLSTSTRADDVVSYAFLTVDGRALVWTFPGGVPELLLEHSMQVGETPIKWEFQDKQRAVFCDIAVPMEQVNGVLHIGLDRREIDRDLRPLLMTITALAVVVGIAGLLVSFLLARRAVREVEVLTEAFHTWAGGGELNSGTPISTTAEVADLARTFKQLCSVRREAEEKVLQQNLFLNNVIGALTHPLYVIDAEDYSIKLANPAAQAVEIEEGAFCFAATHGRLIPCDGVEHPCPLALVKASGKAARVEHVHLDSSGKRRVFEIHGYPVTDNEGRVVQMIEYSLDITQRKEAEEVIRRRNRELALLNWVIGAGASGMEQEGILRTACLELGRALDVDRVVAVMMEEGKSGFRVMAEHVENGQLPLFGEVVEMLPETEIYRVLWERQPIVCADAIADPRFEALLPLFNRFGIVSILLVPLIIEDRVGGILGLACPHQRDFFDDDVGLVLSVAGQLSSSLELANVNATRRRLEAVIEQTDNSVFITNSGGDIVYVNPAFKRVTGYDKAEAVGENPRLLNSDEHDSAFFDEMWSTITEGRVWRGRIVNKNKDGSFFTEDSAITPVRAEDGSITNFVAVNRDVTREIELEEQFLQAQKMEGIGRLAGGIAHDFNNLLSAIMGYSELMLFQVSKDSPVREMIGEVVSASEQAARLTRQLLIFARSQPSDVSNVSLNEIILETEKMFRRLIGEDIQIETVLDPDLVFVTGNPSHFEQVLLNLVVNARDAMPTGGCLTIKTCNLKPEDEGFVGQGGTARQTSICLSVTDTGSGIPDEVKKQIFEPFFTTKERTQGTGLGLSTCYGIVTQCGGAIGVESVVGEGTTFKVFLPACDPDRPTEERKICAPDVAEGSEVILLAEDDGVVRRLAGRTMRDLGYSVLEAVDGEGALRCAREFDGNIDVLVTDVVMPRLRGPDVATALMREFPQIKVVFISGYLDDPMLLQDFGDAILVQKPFKPLDLARSIRGILDAGLHQDTGNSLPS